MIFIIIFLIFKEKETAPLSMGVNFSSFTCDCYNYSQENYRDMGNEYGRMLRERKQEKNFKQIIIAIMLKMWKNNGSKFTKC